MRIQAGGLLRYRNPGTGAKVLVTVKAAAEKIALHLLGRVLMMRLGKNLS